MRKKPTLPNLKQHPTSFIIFLSFHCMPGHSVSFFITFSKFSFGLVSFFSDTPWVVIWCMRVGRGACFVTSWSWGRGSLRSKPCPSVHTGLCREVTILALCPLLFPWLVFTVEVRDDELVFPMTQTLDCHCC